jgi:rare lipoprotein A
MRAPRRGTATLFLLIFLLVSCGHPKQAQINVPPAPAIESSHPTISGKTDRSAEARDKQNENVNQNGSEPGPAEPTVPANARPLSTEIGRASWYGPPYHNRVGSNGKVYNMNAMTAAHRTLPLGSIVRVTNINTGHSALVSITDRGPFIPGRVLDLSLAAARKVDVYQPGVAEVKVELMQTPVPIETGGKWAVQIGGFPDKEEAEKLADRLTRRYRTANVQRFNSPAGDWWVKIRVLNDDRLRAQTLASETETPEGAVFLVRLD